MVKQSKQQERHSTLGKAAESSYVLCHHCILLVSDRVPQTSWNIKGRKDKEKLKTICNVTFILRAYSIRNSQLIDLLQFPIEEQQLTLALQRNENSVLVFYSKWYWHTRSLYLPLPHWHSCHYDLFIRTEDTVCSWEDIVQASDNIYWSLEWPYVPKF